MDQRARTVLSELKSGLVSIYGDRLKGVYLFGSHARGDAAEDSDFDVLIVLDRVDDYHAEIAATSALVSDVSLKYGTSVSRVFAPQARWREDDTMFFVNVRREAVPA